MALHRPSRWSVALVLIVVAAVTGCGGGAEQPAASGSASPSASASPPASEPLSPPPSSAAPAPALSAPAPPPAARSLDTGPPEVLVTGLDTPWGLAFLPGGDALVSERDSARILRVPAAGGRPQEVVVVPGVRPRGEGGLLGLAVSPSFATDSLVYAYFTAENDNRIVRFRLDRPTDLEPVVTGIPKGVIHNGGRLAFGPDGMLYAGTGDSGDSDLAQDPRSLGGKVLRMTPTGQPVEGGTLVFSRGHRNVQGLAFDEAGRVYSVEFGQNRFDEVNQISAGSNGGWPDVEGPGDGGGRFLAPITTWETSESSPSGAAFVDGSLWVAALRGERLWRVPLDGRGGAAEPESLYEGDFGRLRAAERAPDGSLWVLTSNRDGRGDPVRDDDRILRLGVR
ncbi:MAG: PQQ-dependent sugar dehydrogenase [Actinobacteria bacterium]|nr:PQQ-dependent sugar dehydrogenase [Actinomycetota bacterium]MBW3647102.1 PQQ-dependent sugar dehydrogenase [Actinomycetota bacterium]